VTSFGGQKSGTKRRGLTAVEYAMPSFLVMAFWVVPVTSLVREKHTTFVLTPYYDDLLQVTGSSGAR
jgi:hypothetical protein